jgi:ELWxxDGT repeat protein
MPVNLISEASTFIRCMFTHRRSDRRSSRRGVVTESLECRQLLAAVIAPIVDYNINPARLGFYDSVQLNDEVVVFSAYTLEYGSELWRTDGTADGTYRLTDRNAGPQDSEPAKLTRVGDVVYFSMRPSTNASQGVELWKTDGTLVGTQRVNAFSGEPSSITHMVPSSDSQLNFIRNGEVWQTDGTEAGTRKEISFSSAGLFVEDLLFVPDAVGGSTMYITVLDSFRNETRLMRYNLVTDTGTVLRSHTTIKLEAGYGGRLLYTASDTEYGNELWYSDGNPASTAIWMDINPGPAGSEPSGFYVDGTQVWFSAYAPDSGRELWKIQSPTGPPELIDIAPGPADSRPSAVAFAAGEFLVTSMGIYRIEDNHAILVNASPYLNPTYQRLLLGRGNKLYFFDDYFGFSSHQNQKSLFVTDGQNISTVRSDLKGIWSFLGHTAERALFLADDGITGMQVWVSDGTALGTRVVREIAVGTADSSPQNFTSLDGQLAFLARKDVAGGIPEYLVQTTADNSVRDIAVSTGIVALNDDSFNGEITGIQRHTRTINSLGQVSHAIVTWDGSQFRLLTKLSPAQSLVHPVAKVNGILVATVRDSSTASEELAIWSISAQGELEERLGVVTQFSQGYWSTVGGRQFFVDVDYGSGRASLWQTDGTVLGTGPVRNFPELEAFFTDLLYGNDFVITETSDGTGLVYLNVATGGVSVSRNLFSSGDAGLKTLRRSDDGILFARNTEIWFTAGTPESTRLVTRLPAGAMHSPAVTIGQNTWFFTTDLNESPGHLSLTRTDGTAAGTTRVMDFPETKSGILINSLSAAGGKLIFGRVDVVTGESEIWISDGTVKGTATISSDVILRPGMPSAFVHYDHGIAFAAATPETGFEPFRINTTIHVTPPDLITAAGHGNRLSWADIRGAIQYDVWIMSLNNPAVPVRNERVNTPEYELAAELPDGAYRVWTRSYPVLGAPSAWSTPFDFVKGMSPVVHTVPVTSEQQKPLIKWTGPTDVVSYEFWVDNRDKKVRVLHVSGLKAASLQIEQSLEPAVYAVWVRGTRANGTVTNWSALTEFEVLASPVTITHGTGDQFLARPTLVWQAIAGATAYNIQIEAVRSTRLVYRADNVKGLTHQVMSDLTGGEYRVFVRALRGTRRLSVWGVGSELRVYPPPSGMRATERSLSWNPVPLAMSYTFDLRNSRNEPEKPITTVDGTSFQFNPALAPGKYTVRVHSNFGRFSSVASPAFAFEVFRPQVIITTSSVPTADATPVISWKASAGAVSYELVVTGSGVSPTAYEKTGIRGTSHRVGSMLSAGLNQIWVRAHYGDGSRSRWGSAFRLLIGPAPVLSITGDRISWSTIKAATHYEILIERMLPAQMSEVVRDQRISRAQFKLPSGLISGRYQAKVRAVRAESGSLHLGEWSLPLLIDLVQRHNHSG